MPGPEEFPFNPGTSNPEERKSAGMVYWRRKRHTSHRTGMEFI